jgi:hypothetical protein
VALRGRLPICLPTASVGSRWEEESSGLLYKTPILLRARKLAKFASCSGGFPFPIENKRKEARPASHPFREADPNRAKSPGKNPESNSLCMGAALPAGSAPTPRSGGDSMRGLSLDLFLTGFSFPDFSRVFWVWVCFFSCRWRGLGPRVATWRAVELRQCSWSGFWIFGGWLTEWLVGSGGS